MFPRSSCVDHLTVFGEFLQTVGYVVSLGEVDPEGESLKVVVGPQPLP